MCTRSLDSPIEASRILQRLKPMHDFVSGTLRLSLRQEYTCTTADAEANAFSPSGKNKPLGCSSPLLRVRVAIALLGFNMSTIFLGGLVVLLCFLFTCFFCGSTWFAGRFGTRSWRLPRLLLFLCRRGVICKVVKLAGFLGWTFAMKLGTFRSLLA